MKSVLSITFISLIFYGQSLDAMNALRLKQQLIAQLQLQSAQDAQKKTKTINLEQYVQDLFELQKNAYEQVDRTNFSWPALINHFNEKHPTTPQETLVTAALNMTYETQLPKPGEILQRIFQSVETTPELASKWEGAYNAIIKTLIPHIQRKMKAAQASKNPILREHVQMYASQLLKAAKKRALEQYALPYYKETQKITSLDEITGGRVAALETLNVYDIEEGAHPPAPTVKKEKEKETEREKEKKETEREKTEKEKEKPKKKEKKKEKEEEEETEKQKKKKEAEAVLEALSPEEVIEKAYELVTKLPEKLADIAELLEQAKQEKDTEEQQELTDMKNRNNAELNTIYQKYVAAKKAKPKHELVKAISKLLRQGVPRSEEQKESLDDDVTKNMESIGNLKNAKELITQYIIEAKETFEKANTKELKKSIMETITAMQAEKAVLQEILDSPEVKKLEKIIFDSDSPEAKKLEKKILDHEKELLASLDELNAQLDSAESEKEEATIKQKIDHLYKRAPHLLPAAEFRRKAVIKTFHPTELKFYVLAKRDEILRERKKRERKK